jgi:protein-tyrosine phosphatase
VDDGARSLEETLDSVERMVEQGIRRILTTPHLDGRLTLDEALLEGRLSQVTEAFDLAAEAVARRFPEVEFRRGHEVMLDVPDVRFDDPRTRLGGSSFALVEWPRLHLPPGTTRVLHRIASEGYRPIVAHPERYIGIDLALAEQWRAVGAYLQVNYGSLAGRYGTDARAFAFRLLRRGWADYLSSDFHGRPDRKIYRREAAERLRDLGAEESLSHLSLTNPGRVFEDELPLPVPSLPAERGFWAKVKEILNLESA